MTLPLVVGNLQFDIWIGGVFQPQQTRQECLVYREYNKRGKTTRLACVLELTLYSWSLAISRLTNPKTND